MWAQILTLAGVVIGASASFVFTSRIEKARNQREMLIRWDVRRYEAFSDYIGAVTQMARVAGQLTQGRGWDKIASPIAREAGLAAMDRFENTRTAAYERLVMLASQDCIDAADILNKAVWRLEWIAREAINGSMEEWQLGLDAYTSALDSFQQAVRTCLVLPLASFVRQIHRPVIDSQVDRAEHPDRAA